MLYITLSRPKCNIFLPDKTSAPPPGSSLSAPGFPTAAHPRAVLPPPFLRSPAARRPRPLSPKSGKRLKKSLHFSAVMLNKATIKIIKTDSRRMTPALCVVVKRPAPPPPQGLRRTRPRIYPQLAMPPGSGPGQRLRLIPQNLPLPDCPTIQLKL